MEGYVGIHGVRVQESIFRGLSGRVEKLALIFLHDECPFYSLMSLTECKFCVDMLRGPYIADFSSERSDAAALSIVEGGVGKTNTMHHREMSQ